MSTFSLLHSLPWLVPIECHPDYCYSHRQLEPIPEGVEPYMVCFECGHVYLTAGDLEAAYRRESARFSDVPEGDVNPMPAYLIAGCQECLHDF